ncbi:steroid receptor RNA activator 1-like [Osmerus mordax]|uniref:Steroid receptor RNA activator 1 n=1 Tax=Osmerus mordax TaxID=8014 RepID=C1BKC2_OSMMO|nr:Steroid receptor RNA activator 1 [Osmerus mordax]
MEDLYIKPGNQDRGWNDPPQFSYGLQAAQAQGGPKRTLLNKRVPPPQLTGSPCPVPEMTPPTTVPLTPPTNPIAPPPCSMNTPPRACPPVAKPPCGLGTPPPAQCPMAAHRGTGSSQSEKELVIDDVLAGLNWALTACRHTVRKQVCDDVEKRVRLFEDMWRSGRLSLPVRRRMSTLAQELRGRHWDSADDIHRSLMVDHVTEVGQWMVGVKRLIAETRNLSPDLLSKEQEEEEQEESNNNNTDSPVLDSP